MIGLTSPSRQARKKFDSSVHHAVIGQGKSLLPQPIGLFDQVFDTPQPIEHGIFGVNVEVNKIV